MIDISNQRFGKLTALHVTAPLNIPSASKTGPFWKCVCDCGAFCVKGSYTLRSGNTRSCGAPACRIMPHGHARHSGAKKTSEYNSWCSLIQRCTNPKDRKYPIYGGRGISVCDRWLNSFEAFLQDMGPKPHPSLTIERNDGNGNYEPRNCRWASYRHQNCNRNTKNKNGFKGIFRNGNGYGAQVHTKEAQHYIGTFPTAIEAARAYDKAAVRILGDAARINGA